MADVETQTPPPPVGQDVPQPDVADAAAAPRPDDLVPALEGFAISRRDQIDRSMTTSELTLKDKSTRATRQQVLDDRTDAILRDLIRLEYVSEIHGVVSTGKEANVYGAVLLGRDESAPPTYRALKIYKTRILAFKDRERYIEGEYRFQRGSTKGYAMVQVWAQKEFRNLSRLHQARIPCPEPIVLRGHTILMEFLGKKGISYPKLVDAKLAGDDADEQWRRLYVRLLGNMRRMYHVCRLVHADLSEYNILYHDGELYIIDVSQSVEHDHPKAYEFLRMDIKNVGNFFRRRGVATLGDRAVFDFIFAKDLPVEEPGMGEEAERLLRERASREEEAGGDDAGFDAEEVDTEVFRNQYIPQTVHEIPDIGDTIRPDDPLIQHLISSKKAAGDGDEDDEDSEGGASLGSDDDSEDGERVDREAPTPRGHKFEDRDEKKARKQLVKEEKREKRANKIPKHVKKQMIARTSRK